MEINKEELQTMFREFLGLNNECCEVMAVIFLRKAGLLDKEISHWLSLEEMPKITEEDKKMYDKSIQTTKDYFLVEKD